MRWVVKMYTDWRNFKNCQKDLHDISCNLEDVKTITEDSLVFALCRFLTEVKKLDGSDFPGRTLYDILICVQFQLETQGIYWKLLNDERFAEVRYTLDNIMKLRTSQGVGITVKRAQVLTNFDEQLLWNLGLLGELNPTVLLNTVIYLIG